MVRINGKNIDTVDMTFAEYLESQGYSLTRIAVEVNGQILKKQDYSVTRIKDGDVIEIVGFVGGG